MLSKGRRTTIDQDIESICSGSTWTDSGRGPSEEDDHIRTHLDPLFSRTGLDQCQSINRPFMTLMHLVFFYKASMESFLVAA